MEKKLQVGFARVDITPEQYTNLGGLGDDAHRMCQVVRDHIFGSCVAITDANGETMLFCPSDIIHARSCLSTPAREAISEATGIPFDHIMINASHNHSGPSTSSPHLETVQIWFQHYIKQMVKCAKEAMADRKPATVLMGRGSAPDMNYDRHYITNDGILATGGPKYPCEKHILGNDEIFQLVKFQREGGRDVLLVNWQCHVTDCSATPSDRFVMTADYVGVLRNELEGQLGCHFAFFQGAAGNLVPNSRIASENVREVHDYHTYGKDLAAYIIGALDNLQPANPGDVKVAKYTFEEEVDHTDDHLAEKARYVRDHYFDFPTNKEKNDFVREHGFNSYLHANGVAHRAGYDPGETICIDICALSCGDFSFICAPYEMFCSSGKFIKDNTPFPMTFVVTCCNNTYDYMADNTIFDYDVYEVNTRRFARGAAERLAQHFVDLLHELK